MLSRSWTTRAVGTVVAALGLAYLAAVPTAQATVAQDRVVNPMPSTATPNVEDGTVYAIAKVGNKVFLGGDFTSVTNRGSSTSIARNNILAFDATTGLVDTSFVPTLNGGVDAIIEGPGNSLYVAGTFKTVNGANMRVARLDAATGAVMSGWAPSAFSAATDTLALSNGTLFVGGNFAKVGGVQHAGLAALNPTTGKVLSWFNVNTFGHHGTGSATGGVGAKKIDVTPDGSKMVVIGNFTSVTDGAGTVDRDQVMMVDLGASTAQVSRNWRSLGYKAQCYNWAFDSYVRDVQFSPDGSYFVLVATGGGGGGQNPDGSKSLCDAAARFETSDTGTDVRPTWADYAGGDSLWSVAVTGTAVYTGGHQRWANNHNGNDYAGAGAVPRPGLTALDPQNGLPLSWNPGRNPRGAGAFALLATADGLYVGSDTNYVGNFQYERKRIAYFPLAGGATLPSNATGTLPGKVYLAGGMGNARPDVLFRVDAGGGAVSASDGGADWAADTSDPSPYRNNGSNAAAWSPAVTFDSTIPAGTPTTLFDTERWDPGSKNDGGEMQWAFPVASGTTVDVNLYFANRYSGTGSVGGRVFDVSVEGQLKLDNFDIVAAAGADNKATMRTFRVTSDGTINIDLGHEVENPLVNAIEIVQVDPAAPAPVDNDVLRSRTLNAAGTVGATQTAEDTLDWSKVRGAFMVNGMLYYGYSDGQFYTRTFDGDTLGDAVTVDPYNDPFWSDKSTGSGQTYRGVVPGLYGSTMTNVSSMFYANGRVFYTVNGQSQMRWRYFTPESGIMGPVENTVSDGLNWSTVAGAFVTGSTLYYADKSDGALRKRAWDGMKATGSATVVDTTQDWRTRGMFLMSEPVRVNKPPVATFTVSCGVGTLACTFDASGSYDPDGSITQYDWTFGDGQTATNTDSVVTHEYTSSGPKTVTLTVTDNDAAPTSASQTANPTSTAKPIVFRGQTQFSANAVTQVQLGVPATAAPGDTLLLFSSFNVASATSNNPTGWTLVKQQKATSGMVTKIWSKVATPSDPGSTVTITYSRAGKAGAVLAAYTGTAATGSVSANATAQDAGTSTHVTPTANVANAGSLAVSYWADRSSPAATAWTIPSDTTRRAVTYGAGAGGLSTQLADSGSAVSGSTYGGKAASVNGSSIKGVVATLILKADQP